MLTNDIVVASFLYADLLIHVFIMDWSLEDHLSCCVIYIMIVAYSHFTQWTAECNVLNNCCFHWQCHVLRKSTVIFVISIMLMMSISQFCIILVSRWQWWLSSVHQCIHLLLVVTYTHRSQFNHISNFLVICIW